MDSNDDDVDSVSTLTESVHSRVISNNRPKPIINYPKTQIKKSSFLINWYLLKFTDSKTQERFVRFIGSQQSLSSYFFSIFLPYFLFVVIFSSSYLMNGYLLTPPTRYPTAGFMLLMYLNFFLSVYLLISIRRIDRSKHQFIYIDSNPYIRKIELEPIIEGGEYCRTPNGSFSNSEPNLIEDLSNYPVTLPPDPPQTPQDEPTGRLLKQHLHIRRISILIYYLFALTVNANLLIRTVFPSGGCGIGCWLGVPLFPTITCWISPYMGAMGLLLDWEIILPIEILSLLSYIGACMIRTTLRDMTPLNINLMFSMVVSYLCLFVLKRTIQKRLLMVYQQRETMAQFIANENWRLMEEKTQDFFWEFGLI